MQNIVCYVSAENTLGSVRDAYNSKAVAAPVMTRAIATKIKLRLFRDSSSTTAYPLTDLQTISSWSFVMDDDFDSTSNYILVANHSGITVSSVTDTVDGTSTTFTEIGIPIPSMNTTELSNAIGTSETITLNGELVGFDASGNAVFALQIKGFTVRNRISSSGNPTNLASEYLTETQTRALLKSGFQTIFAAAASDEPDDWHSTQLSTDTVFRFRFNGDSRSWTTGDASDYGWSDEIELLRGLKGDQGDQGLTGYLTAITAYNSSTAYAALALVTYGTPVQTYQAISATTAGESPDSAVSKWRLIAARGADCTASVSLLINQLAALTNRVAALESATADDSSNSGEESSSIADDSSSSTDSGDSGSSIPIEIWQTWDSGKNSVNFVLTPTNDENTHYSFSGSANADNKVTGTIQPGTYYVGSSTGYSSGCDCSTDGGTNWSYWNIFYEGSDYKKFTSDGSNPATLTITAGMSKVCIRYSM